MSWLGSAPDRFHPSGRRRRNRDLPMRLSAAVSPGLAGEHRTLRHEQPPRPRWRGPRRASELQAPFAPEGPPRRPRKPEVSDPMLFDERRARATHIGVTPARQIKRPHERLLLATVWVGAALLCLLVWAAVYIAAGGPPP